MQRGHRLALGGPSSLRPLRRSWLQMAALVCAATLAACSPGASNVDHGGRPVAVTAIADLGIPALIGPWSLTITNVPVTTGDLIGEMIRKAGGAPKDAVHVEVAAHGDGKDVRFDVIGVQGVRFDLFATAAGESLFPGIAAARSTLGPWTIARYEALRSGTVMWVAGLGSKIVIIHSNGQLTDADAATLIGGL